MFSLLLVVALAQADAPSRAERVLQLLSEVSQSRSGYYADTIFETVKPPLGSGPVLVPRVALVMCADRDHFALEDERARQLGRELFAIYGLAPEADHREAEGAHAVVVDGLDTVAGLGFELRGRLRPPTEDALAGRTDWWEEVEPEEPALALDADEYAWLGACGIRLHVADIEAYRGSLERFTPMLAYLASLVRFLNDVTAGEDVELGGLLFEREAVWEPRFVARDGVRIESGSGAGIELVVERATTLTLACRGLADLQPAPERDTWGFYETPDETLRRRDFRATRGAPSALYLKGGAVADIPGGPRPDFRLRFRQRVDGSSVERESHGAPLFLPSAVELTEPFELELELAPGRYVVGAIHLGTAARE